MRRVYVGTEIVYVLILLLLYHLFITQQGGEWVITQKMMAQYDHLFDRFDKSCDGFSERIDVESFFESSGLPHNTLDHIW